MSNSTFRLSQKPSPTPALRSYGAGNCEFCGVDFDRQTANQKGDTCTRADCQRQRRNKKIKEMRARQRAAKKGTQK